MQCPHLYLHLHLFTSKYSASPHESIAANVIPKPSLTEETLKSPISPTVIPTTSPVHRNHGVSFFTTTSPANALLGTRLSPLPAEKTGLSGGSGAIGWSEMKHSQAIIVAALGTFALVSAVPLPSQNNNVPVTASATLYNADSTNPAAVQSTPSLNGAPSDGSIANKSPSSLQTRDTVSSVSSKLGAANSPPPVNNNQSGTAPTPVASAASSINPNSSQNDSGPPTRRDIGSIDMGLLTRDIQDELDARGYPDNSAMTARHLANDYDLWSRGLLKDLRQVGDDITGLPATVAANGMQSVANAMNAAGTEVGNFVRTHATIPASGSGTASPGATFRRDLELNPREVLGESGTPERHSIFKEMTGSASNALKQSLQTSLHRQIDDYSGRLKRGVSKFFGSPAPVVHSSSDGYSGEEQGSFERRAPGQEGASSLTSDLLNKRRNVEEYSVHERDFEDYDIYGRDLEIANLD
ncbi:hypothetical protein H0H93_007142 [Arthromyces matolae]|nr:hypothetical protein H0H93_007142 [Arthromyces matolae]